MNIQELKVKPGDMDVSHEDLDTSNTNDYFVTALKVFDYCGADSAGTLKVDALMDQLSPFVNSDKSEFSFLRSLLDPDHVNPEINVSKLAKTLHQYSESQKCKVDLDESFNLRNSHGPQDSDSGISTDGYHLLGELQCELREKSYLALRLRSQLEFTDRQHEEALAALTTERDALRAHVKMLREEHTTLNEMRRDYEESTERLAACELSLCSARGQLEAARRAQHSLEDQLLLLETEKSTLQELLSKSKDECHRINEMYASRQAAILEENEAMKADRAELNIRLQDQEEFMQQIIKEKVLLEMELKDMLNKSNQTQLRMDRSIEISYTEDQMLTALDSLNADSRFSTEHHLLDEESFAKALKEDQGRGTNISLFDEIRLSIGNVSAFNVTCDAFKDLDTSAQTIGTQTDEGFNENVNVCVKPPELCAIEVSDSETQTKNDFDEVNAFLNWMTVNKAAKITKSVRSTQTIESTNNNIDCVDSKKQSKNKQVTVNTQTDLKCEECEQLAVLKTKLENNLTQSSNIINDMKLDFKKYEDDLNILQKFVNDEQYRNNFLQTIVDSLKAKIVVLEAACIEQGDRISRLSCDTCAAECQTECEQQSVSTQAEAPCAECVKRNPQRGLRRYLWEGIRGVFQVLAVACFIGALCTLYAVTRRPRACRESAAVPWRWFNWQEVMDLLLRIEYVADVPM